MKKPEECQTVDEVRAEIDRVDAALMALMAERWSYVDRAWTFKDGARSSSVPWRNQQVIDHVRRLAEDAHMPPELAESVWKEIIAWSIRYEDERLQKT